MSNTRTNYARSLFRAAVGTAAALSASLAAFAAPAGAESSPFTPSATFYQASNGYLWAIAPGADAPVAVNSTKQVPLNSIAYDSANNFIYGVSNTTLYKVSRSGIETPVGSAGSFAHLTTITGDFLPGTNFLVTLHGTSLNIADVTSGSYASASLGLTHGSVGAFGGNDVAFSLSGSNYVGYGLDGKTLYKAVIPVAAIPSNSATWSSSISNALTITTLSSISTATPPVPYVPSTSTDHYASAWTDSAGNYYFFNSANRNVYRATAAQVAAGTPFTLGWLANWDNQNTGAFDGASNPTQASPFQAPSQPAAPSLSVGNATLTVSWAAPSADGGTPVTGYQVMLWGVVYNFDANTFSHTFTSDPANGGITNGQWYHPVVAASNAVAQSLYSLQPANAFPGTAPIAPASVTATRASATSATVKWPFGVASSGNGGWQINNYRLVVLDGGVPVQTINTNSGGVHQVTVSSLTAGHTYYFTVTAVSPNAESATATSSATYVAG